jgi:hypothetical protein
MFRSYGTFVYQSCFIPRIKIRHNYFYFNLWIEIRGNYFISYPRIEIRHNCFYFNPWIEIQGYKMWPFLRNWVVQDDKRSAINNLPFITALQACTVPEP